MARESDFPRAGSVAATVAAIYAVAFEAWQAAGILALTGLMLFYFGDWLDRPAQTPTEETKP